MDSIISKIFPKTNNENLLKTDDEGIWSITLPQDADFISNIICGINGKNKIIVDCTAGLGGNTISFAKYFKKVIGIEISKERFELLQNNINVYNLQNTELINGSCVDFINNESNMNNIDILFFDPPWGGPDYKKNTKLNFKLDDIELVTLMNKIKSKNKSIFLKLPFNYDLDEFNSFNYKIHKIKNYYVIEIN